MNNNEQYQVRSVHRALSILKIFVNSAESLSLTDISRDTGLNQVTTYRLVSTLINDGFLEQLPETGKYRLGVMVIALGEAYYRNNDLHKRVYPKLEELRDVCGETVHMAILENYEIIYIEKLQGLHAIGLMSSRVGGRSPAHCTGIGKVLLAHKSEEEIKSIYGSIGLQSYTPNTVTSMDQLLNELNLIKTNGYAVDKEEHELGVACVAAPIFDKDGVMAAISLSGPLDRIMKSIPELSQQAMRIANEISTFFGSNLNGINRPS